MSWLAEPIGFANPDYYTDATSSTEKQLRAEFAQYYQLREIAPFGRTDADTVEMNSRANDLAMRWGHHETARWRTMWESLQAAVMGWESRPELARRNFDHLARARTTGDLAVDDELWRSLQQARAITGHGHDARAESGLDAQHRYPNVAPEAFLSAALSVPAEPDRRTAVERTLGAPRSVGSDTVTLERIDAVIAETDAALNAEERAGDRDTGREARQALLPRAIRDAPITYDYGESEAWDLRQASLLREIQDLACQHSTIADSFDGHDDQHRITRLETLRTAVTAARRAALRAGVAPADVDRAYTLGRDGLYWSNEPSHPRLGRIAQLTEDRDQARTQAATYQSRLASLAVGYGSVISSGATDSAELTTASPGRGTEIADAIDAVLADNQVGDWTTRSDSPPTEVADTIHTEAQL